MSGPCTLGPNQSEGLWHMYKGLNADSEKMWYQLSNGRTALNLVFRYLDMVTNPHKGGAKDHNKYVFFSEPFPNDDDEE